MKHRLFTILAIVVAALISGEVFAQKMPERRLVRKGNRQYERGDYDSSIDNYSRALQHDPQSFEAKFNTANVQFRKAFVDSLQMDAKMVEKAEKKEALVCIRMPTSEGSSAIFCTASRATWQPASFS